PRSPLPPDLYSYSPRAHPHLHSFPTRRSSDLEKGLDVFADAIDVLQRRGVPHKVVVIGEGPAREWFESRLPDASFVGFQGGEDLDRKSTRLNSSHVKISYAVFCLKKKKKNTRE